MLQRKIISTEDGSSTILIPEWNESYHSIHGAVQESYHVFIKNGLLNLIENKSEISILEIGFGTGLNAFITFLVSTFKNLKIDYTGLEKFPIEPSEYQFLNYADSVKNYDFANRLNDQQLKTAYLDLMKSEWGDFQTINPNFKLKKVKTDFLIFDFPFDEFDLVYFDAFGAQVQPELWSNELFGKIYSAMKKDGLLTTYSSKGSVRRALAGLGFEVKKIAGPPGKREMINAIKS